MTYSIAARCTRTGEFGAAIATAMPAVGALCVWTRSGVGVVCSQSWTNPYLGLGTLDLMEAGLGSADAPKEALARDQKADRRQLGVVGTEGAGFCFTGDACTGWCGHIEGDDFAAQGNMLTGLEVVAALAASFTMTHELPLGERLLTALEAAQGVGGDKRGRQSAAVAVIADAPFRSLDLRVDDHSDPVAELRRVHGVARAQLGPMAPYRPDADGTSPLPPDDIRAMVMTPPPDRPVAGGSRRP
ncbi:MAG: DUF1028 domain-containing protein [Pseudomonadota bacterium]